MQRKQLLKRQKNKSSAVKFDGGNDEEEEQEEEAIEEEDSEESDSDDEPSVVKTTTETAPDQQLVDCRTVMEKIWGRLATREEASVDFLFRLEDAIPYEEEILIMYEEELQRHGIVAALDATDGRAEEALLQEREAAAAANQTRVEEEKRPAKKKKGVKPAVPTIRKRVDLNA